MYPPWMMLRGILMLLSGQLVFVSTTDTSQNVCKTFGSGVVQTFNGSVFYVRSSCPFTLTRFNHKGVDCDVTILRGASGLMERVEIIVNKVMTILHNGTVSVERERVSLPYDHMYQHVFHYGIYTKLRSKVLPLSVTWHSVDGGIDVLWVELDQDLVDGMSGLCGKLNIPDDPQRLIAQSVLSGEKCSIQDSIQQPNMLCREFMSYAIECLRSKTRDYIQLCDENVYGHEEQGHVGCAVFKEITHRCGDRSYLWMRWRSITRCPEPMCPGDLRYQDLGPAFLPTCSNPARRGSDQENTSTCVCPEGKVVNDRGDGHHCVDVTDCACVYAGRSYAPGDERRTKCQTCECLGGKWTCSQNICPKKCVIEGQFVTTFDGKQYALPGKCAYVVAEGLNWTLSIQFSERTISIEKVCLEINREKYTFIKNSVQFQNTEISDLLQTEYVTVFWQSSTYIQVQTFFGMKMQVQMYPDIQLYVTLPTTENGMTQGLCGNYNNDTTDDFTTSSGIIENSAEPFALSWAVGDCTVNVPKVCINTEHEIFADEKCYQLRNPSGVFAKCHDHVPSDYFFKVCVTRTCHCTTGLQECLCVAMGNYARACANQGIAVGDWRRATNCTLSCESNQRFYYAVQACNRTCRSLSGPDPSCEVEDDPVDGCGCEQGTHLNSALTCSPKAQCPCNYQGGMTPPGPAIIDGRQCNCEDGELHCSDACVCRDGKVCVHCSHSTINTAQKTCDSLSKPVTASESCVSGCYCPEGQYEDHNGVCVALENCTCVFSGKVYTPGQSVESNCKTCTCSWGRWRCVGEPCPGKCQVYGNGHYQTFDSKWYRFDGHCQYTLVEDDCGSGRGLFSVRVESVPCCDEALTCSRTITVDLLGKVTLTLSDMKVTRRLLDWSLQATEPLYSIHTVGLYIMISVPRLGMTLIWDKHTRVTIMLEAQWRSRVCGLCGNFDASESNDFLMSTSSVVSSMVEFGNSWKREAPPCSDVVSKPPPCQRNSYCAAWAQRRCMLLRGDIFRECHLKVDPEPYYQACVLESCSCEFEGKFLGFCTAVAAYAEACSEQDVCVKWRTPDLCPVYCDYYNEEDKCSWHYEPCGQIKTCGKNNRFSGRLEGCYPRCPAETPYYDENTEKCSTLGNCSCFFNDTVIKSGGEERPLGGNCACTEGRIVCEPTTTIAPTTIMTEPTTTASTTITTEPTTASTTVTTEPTTTASTRIVTESTTTASTTIATESTTTVATTTATEPTTTITESTTTITEPTTTTESTTVTTEPTTTASTTIATEPTTTASTIATESTTTASTTIATESTTTVATTTATEPTTTITESTTTITEPTTTTESTTVTTEPTTTASTTIATEPTTTASTIATESTTTVSTTIATEPTTASTTIVTESTTTASTTIATVPTTTTTESTTTITEPTTESTTVTTEPTTIATEPTTTASTTIATEPTTTASTTIATESTTTAATTMATEPTTTIATELTTTASTTTATVPTTTITESTTTITEPTTTTEITTVTTEPTTTALTTIATEPTTTASTIATESTTASTTIATEPTTTALTTITTVPTTATTESTTTITEPTTESTTVTTEPTTIATEPTTTASTTIATEPTTTASTTIVTESTTTVATTKATEPTTTITESTTTSTEPTTTTESTTVTTEPTTTASTTIATEPPTTASTIATEPTTTASTTIATESTTTAATTIPTVPTTTTTESTTTITEPTTESTTVTTEPTTIATEPTTTASITIATGPTTTASTTIVTESTTTVATTIATEPTTTITESTTTITEPTTTAESTTVTTEPTTTASTTIATEPTTTASTTIATEPTTTAATTIATEPTTTASTTTATVPTTTITESTTTITEPTTTTESTTITTEPTTNASTIIIMGTTTSTTISTSPTTASTTISTPPTTASTTISTQPSTASTITSTESTTPTGPTAEPIATTASTTISTPPATASTTVSTPPTTASTMISTQPSTASTMISTQPTTTSPPACECKDLLRNISWGCSDAWTEDCFHKTCKDGRIEMTSVSCPAIVVPNCPRDEMSKVSDGCCETWECNCRCDLYGDPHYISFQGTTFDFLDSCTYILVEERVPRHHFTVAVDNYFCYPGLDGSCAKGIILKYRNNTVTLSIVDSEFRVESTLNQVTIQPPYEEQGIRFETTGYMVSVYIDEIRSHVSLTPSNTLVISVATKHFQNNTQGQCGVCAGSSCTRRGGQIEKDTCCDKTAYDWVYEDPLKPHCKAAPRDVPCHPPTGTSSAGSTTPSTTTRPLCQNPSATPLCDLLKHPAFYKCREYVDLNLLEMNCRFDVCLSNNPNMSCSPLAQAAEECKKRGFCVDWRQLTNGSCGITCPKGMVYNECRHNLDDYCRGGMRVPGKIMDELRAGCFCPDGQLHAEEHKEICVSECPCCKGPLGEPKQLGETWQAGCHICSCNNLTRTEECHPKPRAPPPVCHQNFELAPGCCSEQCVEKTCRYKGVTYKVGDEWTDVSQPCVSFSCKRSGTEMERRVCPEQSCAEEFRVWDEQHCCYTCNVTCAPRVSRVNLTMENCSAVVELPSCEGPCSGHSRWVRSGGVLQLEQSFQCCNVQSFGLRSVNLTCDGNVTKVYSYRHVTDCECIGCSDLA